MLVVLMNVSKSEYLLLDSDTAGILAAIRERGNALSWFRSDWPLANHFYRPVSTLFFELDLWLHGERAAGYAWTNALLVAFALPALYALAQRFLNPMQALAPVVLFTLWAAEGALRFPSWVPWGVGALLVLPRLRSRQWWESALMVLAAVAASGWLAGVETLPLRMLEWIPGRTASVMTFFALPALALAFRAFEKREVVSAVGATVCFFLALASYEQAVMLPIALGTLVLGLRLKWRHWHWIAVSAAVFACYLALRLSFVPTGVSRYQDQQFRSLQTFWMPISDYIAPWARSIPVIGMTSEPLELLVGPLLPMLFAVTCWGALAWVLHRAGILRVAAGVALTSVALIAPMAFLHPFEHYHFLPMALHSIFVCLIWSALLRAADPAMNLRWNSSSGHTAKSPETPEAPSQATPSQPPASSDQTP